MAIAAIALSLAGVALIVWATLPNLADDAGTEGRIISVDEARELFDTGEGVLVDTRSGQSFAAGRAAGAVPAPLSEISADPHLPALSEIPDEVAMILYCT